MISMVRSRPLKCQNKRLKCKKKSIWQYKKDNDFRLTYTCVCMLK